MFLYFANANELENTLEKKKYKRKKMTRSLKSLSKWIGKHPSIALVNEAIKVANSAVDSAKWGFFPTPSVDVSQKAQLLKQTARLDQPIWTGGKLTSAYDVRSSKRWNENSPWREQIYILLDNFYSSSSNIFSCKASNWSFDKW